VTKEDASRTMRIDLIADVPPRPKPAERKWPSAATRARDRARYARLFDFSYDAILVADSTGRIADANARAAEFFGYELDEMPGLTLADVVSGADANLLHIVANNTANGRHTLLQAYGLRRNATFFPAEIAVARLGEAGGQLAFFIRDITVRRQAQELLRTEHQAIQGLPAGLLVVDLEGRIVLVNPAAADLWGNRRVEAFPGKSLGDLLDDTRVAEDLLRAAQSEPTTWTGRVTAKREDGARFDVMVRATRNLNANGHVAGALLLVCDARELMHGG